MRQYTCFVCVIVFVEMVVEYRFVMPFLSWIDIMESGRGWARYPFVVECSPHVALLTLKSVPCGGLYHWSSCFVLFPARIRAYCLLLPAHIGAWLHCFLRGSICVMTLLTARIHVWLRCYYCAFMTDYGVSHVPVWCHSNAALRLTNDPASVYCKCRMLRTKASIVLDGTHVLLNVVVVIYLHKCICISVYVYIYIYTHTCMINYIYIYICTHTIVYTYKHIYIYIYIYIYIHIND